MRLKGVAPAVLFPIETLTRELDSKLVMASALAARGCRSIVGHKEWVKAIARGSTGIVWQGKSLFSATTNTHLADQLVQNRSAIMLLHDEGGMHQVRNWPSLVLKTHRIEHLRKAQVNRICVWGERQKEVLSSYAAELKDLISVTGSPRFDLCLPEYAWLTEAKSNALTEKYGSFILACTRFSWAAHSAGQGDPFRRKMNPALWPSNLDAKALADLWFSKWQRDVHDFADFVVLIKELALSFPEETIILRPHPSESLSFYRDALSSFANVKVIRDESVLPWIRAAKLLVHSNCTTGIEAVLAGRPVVNLLPECEGRTELDVEVAREAGYVASSIGEALQKASDFLTGEPPNHGWSPHAKSILSNLTSVSVPQVADQTMKVIGEQGIAASKIGLPKGVMARETVKRLIKGTKATYASSKRGPLDPAYVDSVLTGCRERSGWNGSLSHATEKYVVIDPA
jgi:surface carbohydrate biosynthesis protein